jgi:alkylhydroperoxidase family enzyme
MFSKSCLILTIAVLGSDACRADSPVKTPRPVPATRPEMKELLENMKQRPYRIPLPELSDKEQEVLGERSTSYEARLRFNYIPAAEGTVFGSGRPRTPAGPADANAPRTDFTRNADENMTLTYQFKTMLFWIVSRTNNCQYCLGHQEWKLSATGMKDDAIAALDADWSMYSQQEQAAFAYARLLTYEPHRLSEAETGKVKQHYTPLQVLEMTMSMSGNNAINRWKEGTGIPQSAGNTFTGRGGSGSSPAAEHSDSFTTPTSEKFRNAISIVAPLEVLQGKPSGHGVSTRPRTETRDEVKAKLAEASARTARLPLVDVAVTQAWLKESGQDVTPACWTRLIANFPNEGRGRLPSLVSREKQTGDLTELLKAQLNWIIGRQDRAWYAVGQAHRKLVSLGQTDDQIFALDGDWKEFSEADQSLFAFAKHLAASPIALTDEDAALALRETSPAQVVQTINHVASCAYFDRVTEAAGLAVEN